MTKSKKTNTGRIGEKRISVLDPFSITVREGRNIRDIGDISDLKEQIKAAGQVNEAIKVEKVGKETVLIHGERRLTALKELLNEGEKVESSIKAEFVKLGNESEALLINLFSNSGKPLTPYEEALAYKRLLDEHSFKKKDIGPIVGRSSVHVHHRLQLLEAAPEIVEAVSNGEITVTAAQKIIDRTKGEEDEHEQQKQLLEEEKARAADKSEDKRTKAGRKKAGKKKTGKHERKPITKRELDKELNSYTLSLFEIAEEYDFGDEEVTFSRIVKTFKDTPEFTAGVAEGLRIARNLKRSQIKAPELSE